MKIHVGILASLLVLVLTYGIVAAQDQHPTPTAHAVAPEHADMGQMDSSMTHDAVCDVETFVLQQQAYAIALAAFPQAYAADPESALRTVYYAGLTYQTFARSCGFVPPEEAEAAHDDDHAAEDAHTDEAHMELALSMGDPENGQVLFTTIIPQTGFACSTCHRVDSAETLIGPGLLNIADPAHDPALHEHGESDHEATETPQIERTMDEVVDYIRTSILHPSDFVVPGFPDLLMPQVYEQLLSEQEINDLIAYLITLPH